MDTAEDKGRRRRRRRRRDKENVARLNRMKA